MAIGPGLHIEDPTDPSLDLTMSEGARPIYDRVRAFIADEVEPVTLEFHQLGHQIMVMGEILRRNRPRV